MIIKALISVSLILLSETAEAQLSGILQGEDANVFARSQNGKWQGIAYRHKAKDYATNRIECAIKTDDAVLLQSRLQDSGQMASSWFFFDSRRNQFTNLKFTKIEVGRANYEMTELPWRLEGPVTEKDSIILAVDIHFTAFRSSKDAEWLPLSYLTHDMFAARSFQISYKYRDDETDEIRFAAKTFDLTGFSKTAKWCGKQLLIDRESDPNIRALTN